MTQAELAESAGTSQPAVAAYESGAKTPNLRTLERLASSVGLALHITFVPGLTREDRRSIYLHRKIAEKLRAHPEETLELARVNLNWMRSLHPGASPLLDEWERIIDGPLDLAVASLTDPGMRFRDLRQVTPFAGVLESQERAEVYLDFRREESPR